MGITVVTGMHAPRFGSAQGGCVVMVDGGELVVVVVHRGCEG